MEELVSIITPVYNSSKTLEETIKCVINQTYKNWELILIDDCSADLSFDIIKKYSNIDNRIKYKKLKFNMGVAYSRNMALKLAKGRFIAYLDSDDLWKLEKLEKQINFMIENNYGFTCTSYIKINEKNKILKNIKMPLKIDYNKYLRNTIIQTVGVIIDTSIVNKKYLIMPLMKIRQDAATWCQILKNGNICYGFQELLSYYRVTRNSLSSNKLKAAHGTWNLYRKIEHLSLFKSIYCFIGYSFNAIRKRIYIIK